MIDLSSRTREKLLTPHASTTTVAVVSIETAGVCPPLLGDHAPTLPAIRQMLEKRLEIAREGIHQAQQQLHTGNEEDARILLEKVDEDLHLLRRRVRREFEKAELMTCGV
jgi:hypothetical protein